MTDEPKPEPKPKPQPLAIGQRAELDDDADYRPTTERIRDDQQQDIRRTLELLAERATVEQIAEEVILPAWTVKQRLAERPEWFRSSDEGQTWTLAHE